MCLHLRPVDPLPQETARVAKTAFPKGNTLMKMRDELLGIWSYDPGFDASVRNLKHVARYVTVLASPRVREKVLRKDG